MIQVKLQLFLQCRCHCNIETWTFTIKKKKKEESGKLCRWKIPQCMWQNFNNSAAVKFP